ncbi:MAG: hypothetical protein MHPSP_002011 [Paramarteilia canceri]
MMNEIEVGCNLIKSNKSFQSETNSLDNYEKRTSLNSSTLNLKPNQQSNSIGQNTTGLKKHPQKQELKRVESKQISKLEHSSSVDGQDLKPNQPKFIGFDSFFRFKISFGAPLIKGRDLQILKSSVDKEIIGGNKTNFPLIRTNFDKAISKFENLIRNINDFKYNVESIDERNLEFFSKKMKDIILEIMEEKSVPMKGTNPSEEDINRIYTFLIDKAEKALSDLKDGGESENTSNFSWGKNASSKREILLRAGADCLEVEDYSSCEYYFSVAIAQNEDDPQPWFEYAKLLVKQRKYYEVL